MFARKGLFRNYSSVILYLFKGFDLSILILTGLLTHYYIYDGVPAASLEKSLIIINVFFFTIVTSRFQLYTSKRGKNPGAEFLTISSICLLSCLVLFIASAYLGGYDTFEQPSVLYWLLLWNILFVSCLIMIRSVLRTGLSLCRTHGFNQRKILLIGANANAVNVEQEIFKNPEHGLQVIGYIDDRGENRENLNLQSPYLGQTEKIIDIISDKGIDQVWITYPLKGEERAKTLVDSLEHETTSVRYVIDTGAFKGNKKTITNFANIPLLDIDVSPMDGYVSSTVKKVEDLLGAVIALILLAPLFLFIAIGVKLSSPGPVFYRQTRISWNNKPFEMLKFRSMPIEVENESGAKWATKGENRATKFGGFLRKTSLDELPQFINVLKGDMSIIGPRPERPELIEGFKDSIPDYMKKHMVKAGITGWAQVKGFRGDTDLRKRVEYDLEYIKEWSLLFDLQIAVMTVFRGFIHKNAY